MHRRRSKLRIVRPAASGRSHSLRCCSSQITAGCDLSEPSLRLIEIPAWRLQSTLKRSARRVVGQSGLEPPTSRLSVVCSSQLSYWPVSFRFPRLFPNPFWLVEIRGIAFLRKSHGGCNMPPACCQLPPFDPVTTESLGWWRLAGSNR